MVQAVEKVIEIPMIGKTVTGRLFFFWGGSLLISFNFNAWFILVLLVHVLFHIVPEFHVHVQVLTLLKLISRRLSPGRSALT